MRVALTIASCQAQTTRPAVTISVTEFTAASLEAVRCEGPMELSISSVSRMMCTSPKAVRMTRQSPPWRHGGVPMCDWSAGGDGGGS